MSMNLLAILGGVTGITGVTAAPITNITSSSQAASLLQVKDNFDYKVMESQEGNKFEIKVQELTRPSEDYGLNSFPVAYTELLTPGGGASIPLDLMWKQAEELKKQAEESKWQSWGYTAAALLAKGAGSNGIVKVEGTLVLSPLILEPMIVDLTGAAHGVPKSKGKLKTKVVSVAGGIASQVYYSKDGVGDIFLIQSNTLPPVAIGALMVYAGAMETTDFHY